MATKKLQTKNMSQYQQKKDAELREEFKTKMQELQEQQKQALQESIATEKFPAEHIHPSFEYWLRLALPHETTFSMGTAYPDFKKQWVAMNSKRVEDFNMQEMGLAINCVESKSMVQLDPRDPDMPYDNAIYISIQDAIAVMALQWNVTMEELKKPIMQRFTELGTALRTHYQDKRAK